jgi:hypothetical protein
LEHTVLLDPAVLTDDTVAGADEDVCSWVHGTSALAELPDEAIMEAREGGLAGLGEIQVGKELPHGDGGTGQEWAAYLAEPPHHPGEENPGNAVGEQEVEILLEEQAVTPGPEGTALPGFLTIQ